MATTFDPVPYLTELQLWIAGVANAIAPEPGLPPERRTPAILAAFAALAACKTCFMEPAVVAAQARDATRLLEAQAREAAIRAAAEEERRAAVRAALERHAPFWDLYVPAYPGESREAWVSRIVDHPAWYEHQAGEWTPQLAAAAGAQYARFTKEVR